MRRPTPDSEKLMWWMRSVSGERVPHVVDDPQCGWFTIRLKKGGPLIPVVITMRQEIDPETGELTEPEKLIAEYEGREVPASYIWESARPVSRMQYAALLKAQSQNPEIMAATKASANILDMRFLPPRRR